MLINVVFQNIPLKFPQDLPDYICTIPNRSRLYCRDSNRRSPKSELSFVFLFRYQRHNFTDVQLKTGTNAQMFSYIRHSCTDVQSDWTQLHCCSVRLDTAPLLFS
jgi:hypothetical protein